KARPIGLDEGAIEGILERLLASLCSLRDARHSAHWGHACTVGPARGQGALRGGGRSGARPNRLCSATVLSFRVGPFPVTVQLSFFIFAVLIGGIDRSALE